MNPYKEGQRGARRWHRMGNNYCYPEPRNDYERGWNQYMRTQTNWQEFREFLAKFVVVVAITGLIYLLLILT